MPLHRSGWASETLEHSLRDDGKAARTQRHSDCLGLHLAFADSASQSPQQGSYVLLRVEVAANRKRGTRLIFAPFPLTVVAAF